MGFKNDSISIGDDISIGQNAIFMPYNNNLYIGVSSKDEDRTLCNVNGLHQPNYILNLDCFPSKTRELLRYFMWYLVNVRYCWFWRWSTWVKQGLTTALRERSSTY